VKSLSRVRLFTTPWTVAYQAPPSVGFPRQEYWSGLPLPSPNWTENMSINICGFTVCLSDNAVRFSTSVSTAGHLVPGWEIPQRLEAEHPGCRAALQHWIWEQGLERGRGWLSQALRLERKSGLVVWGRSLPKVPFPDCCFSKSFMLGFRLLAYLHCLYKTRATYIQLHVWFWANLMKSVMFF